MGVRLIVEVLDHWQDVGLTAGERGDLLVLAENANDKSRETWGAVHAPHILKRAGKSAASWRISINRLMKKKTLEFAKRDGKEVRGYTGQHAVYRIVELCPEPPHSGYKGHCTKPVAGSSEDPADDDSGPAGTSVEDNLSLAEEGYPSANPVSEDQEEGYLTANPEGYLTANAVEGLGYLTATERVSGQLTPTPLVSSFDLSSKDSPSSSVAEVGSEGSVEDSDGTDGGGGGDPFFEELHKQSQRVDAFVATLDFRGRAPGKQQRMKIAQRLTVAFKDGWTENGLRRYLDISDDPNVRSAAAVYLHRLSEDELPDATAGIDPQLPPACWDCLGLNPAAAADPVLRVNPITGDPCPNCNPASVGQNPEPPPVCDACMRNNPAARTNMRFRYRVIDDVHQACPDCHPKRIVILAAQRATQVRLPPLCESCAQQPGAATNPRVRIDQMSFTGGLCPRCHPYKVPGDWDWPGRDKADGGMWDRAAARAAQRGSIGARADSHTADEYAASSVDDLFAPRRPALTGTDAKVQGWLDLSRQLAAEEQATRKPSTTDQRVQQALDAGRSLQAKADRLDGGPKPMVAGNGWSGPFKCPEDQSVYDEPFWPEDK